MFLYHNIEYYVTLTDYNYYVIINMYFVSSKLFIVQIKQILPCSTHKSNINIFLCLYFKIITHIL